MNHKKSILVFSLSLISCFSVFFATPIYGNRLIPQNDLENKFGYEIDESAQIFTFINKERQKIGLDPLEWNNALANLAESYSTKMARENFFSHYDKNGKTVAERAKAWKISKWKKIGENLFMAEGYENIPRLAVKGWMGSTLHRQNILDDKFNETGIGIARSKNGVIYITQVFLQS